MHSAPAYKSTHVAKLPAVSCSMLFLYLTLLKKVRLYVTISRIPPRQRQLLSAKLVRLAARVPTCRQHHCAVTSSAIMIWIAWSSLLLASRRPRSSSIFGHWVCQRLLLTMAQRLLTTPSFHYKLADEHHHVWQGLHLFRWPGSSKGAKPCTYHR